MRSVRHYEVMIILDPNQDERTVTPSLDKFLEAIRKDGGKVDKVDVWGKSEDKVRAAHGGRDPLVGDFAR